MNTQFYKTRLVMVALLFALLFSGCAPNKRTQATMAAVKDTAREAVEGKIAAMGLIGSNSLQAVAPDLYAINRVISSGGGIAFFNDAQKIAVFMSPAGKTTTGEMYYLMGVVDTAKVAIVDAQRQLGLMGMGEVKTLSELKAGLRANGFTELVATSCPTVIATLRLAMGFLRSMGTSISHVLVVPAIMLTPEMLSPWCLDGTVNCQQIEQ
jgi:hypothetical protein